MKKWKLVGGMNAGDRKGAFFYDLSDGVYFERGFYDPWEANKYFIENADTQDTIDVYFEEAYRGHCTYGEFVAAYNSKSRWVKAKSVTSKEIICPMCGAKNDEICNPYRRKCHECHSIFNTDIVTTYTTTLLQEKSILTDEEKGIITSFMPEQTYISVNKIEIKDFNGRALSFLICENKDLQVYVKLEGDYDCSLISSAVERIYGVYATNGFALAKFIDVEEKDRPRFIDAETRPQQIVKFINLCLLWIATGVIKKNG